MKYPHLGFDPESFDSLYNINRNNLEMQKFLLFAVCVAGKGSAQTARGLDKLIKDSNAYAAAFGIMHYIGAHGREAGIKLLKEYGIGCMSQRYNFCQSYMSWRMAGGDLKMASLDKLLELKGVGQKTARFFLLYNFPFQPYIAVDTHILKVLRKKYPIAPTVTPSNPTDYRKWELRFIQDQNVEGSTLPVGAGPDYFAKMDFEGWTKGRSLV